MRLAAFSCLQKERRSRVVSIPDFVESGESVAIGRNTEYYLLAYLEAAFDRAKEFAALGAERVGGRSKRPESQELAFQYGLKIKGLARF